MLTRLNRLTRQRDFAHLYQRGERLSDRHFLIRIGANRQRVVRVGVVISTKVAKRAVDRNQHKRQVRPVIRDLLSALPTGWDILITVRQTVAAHTEWPAFREELRNLLKRRFSA
jgi:ribonuclease P protein component